MGAAPPPSVGIFWWVGATKVGGVLVTDATPLTEAEPYGDCLTHPRSHYEVWEGWKALSADSRVRHGIPGIILMHEYEEFPRGRIVYSKPQATFWVYADRRLQSTRVVSGITAVFGLSGERWVVRSDAHYRL